MPGGQKFLRQSARKEGTERKRRIERERFRRRQRERETMRERERERQRDNREYMRINTGNLHRCSLQCLSEDLSVHV